MMIDIDETGLYRSVVRLSNSSLSFDTKIPILLNKNH